MFGSRFYFVPLTCFQFTRDHCEDGRMRTLKFVFIVGVWQDGAALEGPNESELDCSISAICAAEFCGATVRIVGESRLGREVLQRRLSGELHERFQRLGCGHPPDCGTAESKAYGRRPAPEIVEK
jgi:hypothetical protein